MNEICRSLVERLRRVGWTISAAESCTGGMISASIVGVSGASAVFPGGVVTYAPEMKSRMLGVDAELIEREGVVSAAVAEEMALGCRRLFGTELAVSVTGLAGPGGGTETLPVGRVHIGVATPTGVTSFCETFPGDREAVRRAAAELALRQALAHTPES